MKAKSGRVNTLTFIQTETEMSTALQVGLLTIAVAAIVCIVALPEDYARRPFGANSRAGETLLPEWLIITGSGWIAYLATLLLAS